MAALTLLGASARTLLTHESTAASIVPLLQVRALLAHTYMNATNINIGT